MKEDKGWPFSERPSIEDTIKRLELAARQMRKQKAERTVEMEEAKVADATDPTGFVELATRVGRLVAEKNQAYGSSFDKAGEFLTLLYPNGISPAQYSDMLCVVRIFDKLMRIATDRDALGESPFQDVAGYGLLGLRRVLQSKGP